MQTLDELLAVMARLRDPKHGCPWDVQQDFSSIAPYTIEEAYEVADAITRQDHAALRDELGDLLLQVIFHAQMAREQNAFDFEDVVRGLRDKLIRRHRHVFGPEADNRADLDAIAEHWETIKRHEREQRGETDASALAGITSRLPEWLRCSTLQKRAARTGFEWPQLAQVFDKLREELLEVEAEAAHGLGSERLEEEIGDLLFVALDLARHARIDPGSALRRANAKFERRFRHMETQAQAGGRNLAELDLEQQQTLWQAVKQTEG